MVRIIHYQDVPTDTDYEKGLNINFGINDKTCGNPQFTMGYTIIPPGSRNQRHYHANCDAGFFVLKGRIRLLIGEGENYYETEVGEGTFVYIPRGEIHGIVNCSDTEDARLVFTYPGVPNQAAAGTTFVEGPEVVEQYRRQRAGTAAS